MTVGTRTMTAEELERMPPDHLRHELVRGELRSMAPSGFEHGAVIIQLTRVLANHVHANRLGIVVGAETGFIVRRNPDTVRGADIAFVTQERIQKHGIPQGFWEGSPDLAVEVLSPGDTVFEVEEKVADYLGGGCRAVWVLNSRRRTVTVYRPNEEPRVLRDSDVLEGQDVIRGFRHPISDVFLA